MRTQAIGFTQVNSWLQEAEVRAMSSMKLKVDAAIKIAALVLVKINNKDLEKLLNLPAKLKDDDFLKRVYSDKELPQLSLLGCIVLDGIEKSQRKDLDGPSHENIYVSGSDFLAVFNSGQRFGKEIAEIEKLTNGFIKILVFLHRNPTTGNFIFNAMCDYTKDFSENLVVVQ